MEFLGRSQIQLNQRCGRLVALNFHFRDRHGKRKASRAGAAWVDEEDGLTLLY